MPPPGRLLDRSSKPLDAANNSSPDNHCVRSHPIRIHLPLPSTRNDSDRVARHDHLHPWLRDGDTSYGHPRPEVPTAASCPARARTTQEHGDGQYVDESDARWTLARSRSSGSDGSVPSEGGSWVVEDVLVHQYLAAGLCHLALAA